MKTGDLILGAVVALLIYKAYKTWIAPSASPSSGQQDSHTLPTPPDTGGNPQDEFPGIFGIGN